MTNSIINQIVTGVVVLLLADFIKRIFFNKG